ncbi:MAG TPA: hypothetical protein VII76_09340 [Acidimicrobiales bacterium]
MRPLLGTSPRGVLVLGMHRSGTSAATRLVNVLGPATCAPAEMVRGPWNPSGHFESRTLMHLNNALLTQMGRTWWYPPPAGDAYDAVAARITTTHGQARRAFRRVHRSVPWVWKDPRTSVLLPFWRGVLGHRIAAVVVVRNPLEVAVSMQRRHDVPVAFGVALWERYNRLILLHSAGLPVLVTRYDDLVHDPGAWSDQARSFLAGLGMRLASVAEDADTARDFIDPDLRHSTHTRADLVEAGDHSLALYDVLEAAMGPSTSFQTPVLPSEPPAVATELDTVGAETELAWHPPPWAAGPGGPPTSETEGRT